MKALTVHGVWAWCIMHAGKNVENRSWTPPLSVIGSRIAIHAGQNGGDSYSQANIRELHRGPKVYPKGAILGTVLLKGFVNGDNVVGLNAKEARQISMSDWARDGNAWWVLEDPQPLAKPLACKGALGLWIVPDAISTQLQAAEPTPVAAPKEKSNKARPSTATRSSHGSSESGVLCLDGNMRIGDVEGPEYERAIAALIGDSVDAVRARIQSAHRKMKLGNAFWEGWPDRHTELGNWTVAFANEREAMEEIADKFGLSFSVVEKRLAKAPPDAKVRKVLRAK